MNIPQRITDRRFFTHTEVTDIARDLLGKILVTHIDGQQCAVRITETEAYKAPEDRASHAYGNRLTPRTNVMFQEGGCAYIYLCYGLHSLFNVVTGPAGHAHAVLIRAGEPVAGLSVMFERRKLAFSDPAPVKLTTGPGSLAQALGLSRMQNGHSLLTPNAGIWLEADGFDTNGSIQAGPRIGVDYAGECAGWPWRFWLASNPFVSKFPSKRPKKPE